MRKSNILWAKFLVTSVGEVPVYLGVVFRWPFDLNFWSSSDKL